MNLAIQPFVALTASAMFLALAPLAPAQTAAHGIQAVIDSANPLGPMHGQASGTWVEPGLQEGHLYANLYDSEGIDRFTLTASLTEYLFIVAAPSQGEIHGMLLVPHVMPGRGVAFALTTIYAMVEGTWIETSNGRGAFVASILQPSDDPDAPVIQIGLIQGTFQLLAAQAGRVQASESALSNIGTGSDSGSATNGMSQVQLAPSPIVVYPSPRIAGAQGFQLVGDDVQRRTRENRRALNNHGGLGQVVPQGSSAGATLGGTNVVNASRGRVALRWELFE